MSEYGKALLEALASKRAAMLTEGKRPVAVRLTAPEIRALRDSLTLFPSKENDSGMRIFGLAIIEINKRPLSLEDRFVMADDKW